MTSGAGAAGTLFDQAGVMPAPRSNVTEGQQTAAVRIADAVGENPRRRIVAGASRMPAEGPFDFTYIV